MKIYAYYRYSTCLIFRSFIEGRVDIHRIERGVENPVDSVKSDGQIPLKSLDFTNLWVV